MVNVDLPTGLFLVSAQPSAQRAVVWRFEGNGIVTGPHGVRLRRPSLDGIFYDLQSSWERGEGLDLSMAAPPARSRSTDETPDSKDATIAIAERGTGATDPPAARSKFGCATWAVIFIAGLAVIDWLL